MPDSKLLWRLANESTLNTLRGESRGQYDIRLGSHESIDEFFTGLPRIVDHEGSKIEIVTERVPSGGGTAEIPPYELGIRQMSDNSKRGGEWYIRAQRPSTAYPLWRPANGPLDETAPDTDYVLLARTADDRFYAAWLRGDNIGNVPAELRKKMQKRAIGVTTVGESTLSALALPAIGTSPAGIPSEDDAGEEIEQGIAEAPEGQARTVMHVRRERSRRLRAAKVAAASGQPICEVCGFDFGEIYGDRGRGFIECHHLIPVSELDPGQPTRLEDLAFLCANCHRMIHAGKPWLTVAELRSLLH